MALLHFDAVGCRGLSLAIKSLWSWFSYFLCYIFIWCSCESWMEFCCEWWSLKFQKFWFWRRHSFPVFKESMWNELSDSELPCKSDIWACLPLNYRHAPFTSCLCHSVVRLISPCFNRVKANEMSPEWNIICHWKKGTKTKSTFGFFSLKDSYMAMEEAGETAEFSSAVSQ